MPKKGDPQDNLLSGPVGWRGCLWQLVRTGYKVGVYNTIREHSH